MSQSATLPKPTPRTRKKRGEGTLRRAEILASAKRLFLQEGIEHATMRRIAADVGVSSTALYVYFPDKTAILDAIAEAMFEALLASYAASQDASKPPLARFRDGLMAYVDLALSRPDEYRLTFTAKSQDACKDIEAADKSFNLLVHNVAELMQAGLFRKADPLAAAETMWACMHGVVMLVLNQPEHLETPPRLLIDLVIDTVIRGFQV
jgi:AcrR family transcriptional regulator